MKFTDGFWLMRPGVDALYAKQIQSSSVAADNLRLLATPKVVNHRGATLNTATFSISIDAPLAEVVRVRVVHHAGGQENLRFPLLESPSSVAINEDDDAYSFQTGDLLLKIKKSDWSIEYLRNAEVIASQGAKSLAFIDDGRRHYVSAQLSIGVGENIYGLGERFTPFIKNGQSVDIWNADGGTSSEQAYKNIPFYISSKGYGLFVNECGPVSFEVGSEAVERVQFSLPGQELEYLFILGPTPKEVLEKYTALTGRAPALPDWSFGLWLSTSFVTDYDEKTVTSFIDEMSAREIPLSVFHFDCFWMREFQWCDFEWDPRVFPEPEAMLSRLKAKGLKISLWINPYIGQASPLFAEAKALGYLLTRPDGSVWQWDLWQAGNAIVDFTNPDACSWFQSKLEPLLAMGVDCFKTDFGERIPTDVRYFNGADPEQMHNLYTQLYNKTVWDLLRRERGKDAILFARSATVGGQSMPVHWGGDNTSSFESMAESLRGGLSLALSGFGYWSHDIGGFEGTPDPAVFKRWIAFGLLSSHSRLHGNESVRVPWSIDEESVAVTRHFANLKLSLQDYLRGVIEEVVARGTPMMRPMFLEFPTDPTCQYLDRQYMFGPDLLVAPVFSHGGEVLFYLPSGKWRNHFTGEIVAGGQWRNERHDFFSLPLYWREFEA